MHCTLLLIGICLISVPMYGQIIYVRACFEINVISTHLTRLDCVIAKGHSVCPSVHHTGDPHANGAKYCSTFHTLQEDDASSFFDEKFSTL